MPNKPVACSFGRNPALFVLEIPVIRRPERIAIPANMVPFSKRGSVDSPARYAVCCYELDRNFAPLLKEPEAHVGELRRFQALVS